MTVVIVVAVLAIIPVVLSVQAAGARRETLAARRGTISALRRLRAVVDECAEATSVDAIDALRRALTDVLGLRGCWYEPEPLADGIPELALDGDVSTLVQRRDQIGIVLPDRLALRAGTGRFVMLGNPAAGTTPEQRLLAIAIAGLLAPARRGAEPSVRP